MQFKKIGLLAIASVGLMASANSYAFWGLDDLVGSSSSGKFDTKTVNTLTYDKLAGNKSQLNPKVFDLGMKAYTCASKRGVAQKPVLTIIDYSKPSSQPRMWVIDLAKKKVKYQQHVAHGKNSGDLYAKHFSNKSNSLASSLGVYQTASTYNGKNGYSLRLQGLEPGFNNNAMSRAVVIHGANYVDDRSGRVGRSWGCPAVSKKMLKPTINTIKGGSLVFAYYPDSSWLRRSSYLHC